VRSSGSASASLSYILQIFKSFGVSILTETTTATVNSSNIQLIDYASSNTFFVQFAISPFIGMRKTYAERVWNTHDLTRLLCLVLHSEIGRMCGHWFHKRHNAFMHFYIRANAQAQDKNFGNFVDKSNKRKLLRNKENLNSLIIRNCFPIDHFKIAHVTKKAYTKFTG